MDAIKTFIDQILSLIKNIGSENSVLGNVIEALREVFSGFFK